MIFWRTHWAWSCDWEEWDPNGYNSRTAPSEPGRWNWRSTHFGDYETAMDKHAEIKALPPGQVRNITVNRRAVGAPMNWLKS